MKRALFTRKFAESLPPTLLDNCGAAGRRPINPLVPYCRVLSQHCREAHARYARVCPACIDESASPMQIHWFSIINSCVTVLLLTGFLATILMRVLKNDFIKYTRDDEAGMRQLRQSLHGLTTSYKWPQKGSCFLQQACSFSRRLSEHRLDDACVALLTA